MKTTADPIRLAVYGFLAVLVAFFLPWWCTPILAVFGIVAGVSQRLVSLLTFGAWFIACLIRDITNDFGPSRIFGRLFSFESIDLGLDTIVARLLVSLAIACIGLLLGFFAAGLAKSVRALAGRGA